MSNKNFHDFFLYAKGFAEGHGIEIKIRNTKKVYGCSGYFDGTELVVARKCQFFEEVFVHEFAHMMQAFDEEPVYENCPDIWTPLSKGLEIQDWDSVYKVIVMERDCESRALKIAKKWNLFDRTLYAQRANAYLYFYHFVFLTKTWGKQYTNIYHKEIINKMPKKLLPEENFKTINMDLMMIYFKLLK